jgi:acyl-CoA synthetase (NDP forming)
VAARQESNTSKQENGQVPKGVSASDIGELFRPRSIAIVGVPRGFKAGKVFLLGLLDQGFSGPLYPVHPEASEIDAIRAYRSLDAVPGDVDMVIVLVPRDAVPDVMEQCARKKVKFVVLYTSGYREAEGGEGAEEEGRLCEYARRGGFRILGPNCMGIYCPETGLAFFPGMPKRSGHVAVLSQSGSLSSLLTNACVRRGIFFSKVVSYGNGADLDLPELLDYLYKDPSTGLVCAYCEGIRDGRALVRVLREGAGSKPLIFWKVGVTPEGRQAAASHTGSLCGSARLWDAAFRQYGVCPVEDIEECIDRIVAFSHFDRTGEGRSGRVAVISGPGGPAVSAADAAGRCGLALAELTEATRAALKRILPRFGTSVRNPIDVGLAASFSLGHYLDTLEAVAQDPTVDVVLMLGSAASEEMNREYIDGMIRVRSAYGKPLIAIAYPGFLEDEGLLRSLWDASIPVYPTPERALSSYAAVVRYRRLWSARPGSVAKERRSR